MGVTLDGQRVLDQQVEIEQGSLHRDSIEQAFAGLDGVLSIDLGSRSRAFRQKGTLRANSKTQLNDRISEISSYMDGDTHTLVTESGQEFENLRMDKFETSGKRASGSGWLCDYEIVYTQLRV